MKTEIFKSFKAFLEREDKSVNGVRKVFAARSPGYGYSNSLKAVDEDANALKDSDEEALLSVLIKLRDCEKEIVKFLKKSI